MDDEDSPAAQRRQRRLKARRYERTTQSELLIAAARLLVPDHGAAIPLAWLASHAGVGCHVARTLFNTTAEVATTLVCRAWDALLDRAAPRPGDSVQQHLARLITGIRAEAPAERVRIALDSKASPYQRATIEFAEAQLALAIALGLREFGHDLGPETDATIGRRVLALSRSAALDPSKPDPHAEAAAIVRAFIPGALATIAPDSPRAEPDAAAPTPTMARGPIMPAHPAPSFIAPPRTAPLLAANAALAARPRGHDPPARVA